MTDVNWRNVLPHPPAAQPTQAEIDALVAVMKSRGRNNSLHDINRAADALTAQQSEIASLVAELAREEGSHADTVDQRDHAENMADQLANAIGGGRIGEHSSANCPWQNALDIAETEELWLAEIGEMLDAGQGDDDGPQILPDFKEGQSVHQKVAECLHLLEKRRDVIEALQAQLAAAVARAEKAEGRCLPVTVIGRAQSLALYRWEDWDVADMASVVKVIKAVADLPADAKGGE